LIANDAGRGVQEGHFHHDFCAFQSPLLDSFVCHGTGPVSTKRADFVEKRGVIESLKVADTQAHLPPDHNR